MSNLNQTQKDYLKTVADKKLAKRIKKQFKIVNRENIELNETQKNFLKNVDSEFAKNKLINLFKKANLKLI
jgi:predicted transglutaminase-like protease